MKKTEQNKETARDDSDLFENVKRAFGYEGDL